jgi:alpha-L-fucosidase
MHTRHVVAGLGMILLAVALGSASAHLNAGPGERLSLRFEPREPTTAAAGRSAAEQSAETKAARDARMAWWREARFGMFIHWGLYALPAGEYKGQRSKEIGEWIMSWANIPRSDYEQFAGRFNPVKFDAREWVRIAKQAGMKYIVITSKHHDGFAMFDSKVSSYEIVDATPYKKDVMKALAAETRRQGLHFCFYYSIMDWHHPSQFVKAEGKDPTAGNHKNEIKADQKAEYLKYMKAQLAELITNYDPDVLWFDGEWGDWWTEADGEDLYAYMRGLKPSIIVNNRVGKSRNGMAGLDKEGARSTGDFGTPEQQIPASGLPGVDWESCMTMNDTWGFKSYDQNWKSAQTIVRNLIDIASKGGNYLLNVGPTAEGLIPPPTVERLAEVGRWMQVNGESIYGTGASPFTSAVSWGRVTSKPGKLYLHVFDWPARGELKVPAFSGKVQRAHLLADPSATVSVRADSDGTALTLPATPPDPQAAVVVLDVQ